ncbi:MAG: hypothetical protein ACHREM_24010, partial [Polyangiales bacterium]
MLAGVSSSRARRKARAIAQAVVVVASASAALVPVEACRRHGGDAADAAISGAAAPSTSIATSASAPTRAALAAASAVPTGPVLASIQMQTFIYEEPKFGSTKLGYLRAGAILSRDATPAGTTGCPGGWYAIKPFGYVCIGEGATLDTTMNPIVRATSHRRPDLNMPMPYRYGFIRFVAPQYLKVPTKEEQLGSEMSLEQHLAYYKKKRESELADVGQGANDVPESERSAPLTKAQWSPDLKPGKQAKHEKEDDDASDDASDEPATSAGVDGGIDGAL